MDDDILASEAWKPIKGFEGRYAVSIYGEVYSFRRSRRLKAYLDRDGYPRVTLLRDGAGTLVERKLHPRVHRLVAEAFHADKRNALHHEVAHLDGVRTNADADNLKWVSHVENHSHRRQHGTNQAGEKHPRARLTAANVIAIRHASIPYDHLAKRYGVSRHTISDIKRGRRWASIPFNPA